MKRVLVIDGNYLCHRSYHAHKELSYKGIHTGTLYGFLSVLNALVNTFKPDNLGVCWDSKQSLRRMQYPQYKEGREHEVDVDWVRKRLEEWEILVNSFRVTGYEADDLLAMVTTDRALYELLIFSNDGDLFQLLDDDIHLLRWNNKTKEVEKYTQRELYRDYGLRPWQWAMVKAMAGCSTDNVQGLERVGEATAIKYLAGTLPESTKAFKLIESEEGQGVIERNLELVVLPFDGTPECRFKSEAPVSVDGWEGLCADLGMASLCTRRIDNNLESYNAANRLFLEEGKV